MLHKTVCYKSTVVIVPLTLYMMSIQLTRRATGRLSLRVITGDAFHSRLNATDSTTAGIILTKNPISAVSPFCH